MFGAMAIGAFNDNYFKNALIILITYVLARELSVSAEVLISVAAACFILPFFLFSGFAGMLADKFPKHQLVRALKITELLIVIAAGIALLSHHLWALLTLLFLLGTQAAFFGPTKYAILPELVKEDELLTANGITEAGTFVSILLGTIFGGLLILHPQGTELVAGSMVALSLLGLLLGWKVPVTQAKNPTLAIPKNPFASLWDMITTVWKRPELMRPIIGISWFWAIGAVYLTQIPVFTKDKLGLNQEVVTCFLALCSLGIAVGALACPHIIKYFHPRHIAPISLFGLCLFGLDLVIAGNAMTPASPLVGLSDYLHGLDHWRMTVDLFLMAVCGGIFTIPLYTRLQLASDDAQRARAIASNNVMNALFISIASVLAAGLYAAKWSITDVLLLFALANLPVALLLWKNGKEIPS
jgi:acyl-[acyl-carrier-protein]-phospholipid O-acyltransferase/long-chain-fatty-acid--[acyl-carrier-protein] ligase